MLDMSIANRIMAKLSLGFLLTIYGLVANEAVASSDCAYSRPITTQEALNIDCYDLDGAECISLISSLLESCGASGQEQSILLTKRAMEYREISNDENFKADIQAAIDLHPTPFLYQQLAGHYLQSGDYNRAISLLDKSVLLDRKYPHAYMDRSIAYSNKNEIDKAITDVNTYIKLMPEDSGAYKYRADLWLDLENYDKALADVQKAIDITKQSLEAIGASGSILKDSSLKDLTLMKDRIISKRKSM